MKYRIKIIELNNGVKKYIPQIKTTLHPIKRKEWVRNWKMWEKVGQPNQPSTAAPAAGGGASAGGSGNRRGNYIEDDYIEDDYYE